MIRSTRFDELKATGQLPSPTGVALTILRLTQDDKATVAEITRVLQSDPALAGRILKYANSAAMSAVQPIVSVSQAVMRLGLRTVRRLALGFSIISNCRRNLCPQFDYQRFWSCSLATAIAAQALAHHTKTTPPDEAFTCGLLCQIGRLAFASVYPREYSDVLALAADNEEHLLALEQQTFATDHNDMTVAMLADWGLPETCVNAVRYFGRGQNCTRSSNSSPEAALADLLHVASHLAAVCVAEQDERDRLTLDLLTCGEYLRIGPTDLMALADRVGQEWQEWGKLLDVPTQSVPPFADLVERARRAQEAETPHSQGTNEATTPLPSVPMNISPSATGGLRLLVVDDSPVTLRLLTKQLTDMGHIVHTAEDGHAALRLVLETNPQLIITDWQMPALDGIGLCQSLRQTRMGQQLYIIMLTANEDEDHLVQALSAGADDYMVKPVRPRTLEARLRAAQRILRLQEEIERDKEKIQRYAAELAIMNRKLEQAAFTDALTNLPNRRYATDRLKQEWAESVRSHQPLACLMMDIDHFKQINDTYGHDVGDVVLQETAAVLRQSLRLNDVVCRMGGEEFLVICPDTDVRGAVVCAERLRRAVEAHIIRTAEFNRHVTLSIGVAARGEGMPHPDVLLRAADQALYAAKRSGRNRVCAIASVQTEDKLRQTA
ncbi:MAG: diguanylate cyclase [Abditibacteriales bacterium]|nr:diguanylate cyclase [Abditibacteriales bacterium]